MLNKVVFYFTAFFAFLVILSTYAFHFNILTAFNSLLIFPLSLVLAYFIITSEKIQSEKVQYKKPLIALFILFIASFAIIILPSFIFPFTVSDFMNHSNTLRKIVTAQPPTVFLDVLSNPLDFMKISAHFYMTTYINTATLFYHFIENAYIVNTLLPIIFHLLTLLLLFLLTKKLFEDERIALLVSFIYGFSIVSFLLFVGGYLTQIMATFFFVASVYFYLINKKKLLVLSCMGLISYPPFFVILFIFFALEFFKKRNWKIFLPPFIAAFLMFPESFLLLFGNAYMFSGYLQIGGITTPNPLAMLIFLFAIVGIFFIFSQRIKENSCIVWNLSLAIVLMMLSVFARFAINFFLQLYTVQIHQLYMAVKYLYLLVIPLSVLAALGVFWFLKKNKLNEKHYKIALFIIAVFVGYHFLYGFNYSFVIKNNEVVPSELYSIAEQMDRLPAKFTVGIDECFLQREKFTIFNFPYHSFFDNPSESKKGENKARHALIGRAFDFHWTIGKNSNKGYFEIFDEKGNLIVKYGSKKVDYFITDCSELNALIFLQEGNIKVYSFK